MTARRLIIDGAAVLVVLGFISTPCLKIQSPGKNGPFVAKSKLLACAPVFGFQTNAGIVNPKVTLTVSNAGLTDLECVLWYFDCRQDGRPETPISYSLPTRSLLLKHRSGGSFTLVESNSIPSNRSLSNQACCYGIHWMTYDWWRGPRVTAYPLIAGAMRRAENLFRYSQTGPWNGEEGWTFESNLGVARYFAQVHKLDYAKYLAEEEQESEPFRAASEQHFRLAYSSGGTPDAEAVAEADKKLKLAYNQYFGSARYRARRAFADWYFRGGGSLAQPGTAPNATPPHR